MFRGLWQRIARLFGGGKQQDHRAPGGIPAPETLVAKVKNVRNKDRDILRVAGEALRRGHPDQAVIAYWKAVQVYLHDGQLLKAISALKMILQHSPEDLDAFNALADAYEALERKRDAANTCLWIADILVRRGQRAEALAVLYRAIDLDPMVKGSRERIQALGGELPGAARGPSIAAPKLRLQSRQEPPSRAQAHSPPIAGIPAASPLPPAAVPPAPDPLPAPMLEETSFEEEPMEMPGAPVEDDDKLELDIEGDDALDFPNDSLVLPVTEAKPSPLLPPEPELSLPESTEPEPSLFASTEPPDHEFEEATVAADDDGNATIAMHALGEDGEMMSEDLANDATVLAMEAPPWDGPTDEYAVRSSFEEETEPPRPLPLKKFSIPSAATTVDLDPPSAMRGSEHDSGSEQPSREPRVGIPGDSTRAYSVEELRNLGLKTPKE